MRAKGGKRKFDGLGFGMRYSGDVAVWLGAPLLASVLCTMGWAALAASKTVGSMADVGTMANLRVSISMGIASLVFTTGGSTLMSLMFAGMAARPILHRYFVIIGLGPIVGSLLMAFTTASLIGITAGTIYGVVTALCWVGLHRAIHRSRQVR